MIKESKKGLLIIETRDGENLEVGFSALNIYTNQFLWRNWVLDEKWLISLLAANNEVLLLQRFDTMGSPERKSLIAASISKQEILWEAPDFSFYNWDEQSIWGIRTTGDFPKAGIEISTGKIIVVDWMESEKEELLVESPAHYGVGTQYYETVKKFISQHVHQPIEMGVEYLEYNGFIFLSVYFAQPQGLANYLIVFNANGEMVLKEQLAEKVSGLGLGTFFILSGCLIFVKNKLELVVYKFV